MPQHLDKRSDAQQRNHPQKQASIKVEPIRDLEAIKVIKDNLSDQPRNHCLFTLGINTAYRARELLSLRIGDVKNLTIGDRLEIKQSKNQQYRAATLNTVTYRAVQHWIDLHPKPKSRTPLFLSQTYDAALTVSAVNRLVKDWCNKAGLVGNYGSHTLRKTWGYHQRVWKNAALPLLVRAYGHASEAQTLDYLCIQPDEIRDLYLGMEL